MKFNSLKEGAIIHAVVTGAGMQIGQNFRFVKPFPPYSEKQRVHVSLKVIRAAQLSLSDLVPGVVVKVSVKPSTNRQGKPSWTAASLHLAPDFKPADTEPTHFGVIDAGGVQHLLQGDAWFLENVIPRIERDKVVIYKQSLAEEAQLREEKMRPGAVVMFHFDGHWISAGDLYDPARLKSDLLLEGLAHLGIMRNELIADTILELIRRDDHESLVPMWPDFPPEIYESIIPLLVMSGDLAKLGPPYPERLVTSAFDRLPPVEALTLFPGHPAAWKHPEVAATLCSKVIDNGISLGELFELCSVQGATSELWPLLVSSHRDWIVQQTSDPTVFESLPSLTSKETLQVTLDALRGDDLQGKAHLVPWLSDSVLGGWLDQFFDKSFEPEQDLVEALIDRRQQSRIRVPNAIRVWGPPFWRSEDLGDLLMVIDHHYRRLLANHADARSLALIAEAIGLMLHTYAPDFNDPDRWQHTPADWIDHVIEIVRNFPEIDEEIQMRSAFGTWDQQVGFEGPSRVWLHRDNLEAGWPTFTPNDKILAIYLLLSRGDPMPSGIRADDERHPMVRAFLTLIDGSKQDERSEIAVRAHDLITEAVLKRIPAAGSRAAISLEELVIDFDRALPRCRVVGSGVQYCEGNHRSKPTLDDWRNGVRSQDLTPEMTGMFECHCHRLERARGGYRWSGCPVQIDNGQGEARLFARNSIPWTQWTLLEALKALGYPPNLIAYFKPNGTKPRIKPERIVHNEYVNKIAAVVNRINDLRDRLRCGWRSGQIDRSKGCGQPLSPNFSFSVFPAAYGITVFGGCTSSCAEMPHDKHVYFNHCKRCMSIIDSRESPVKDDSSRNTYVCVHCGGWGGEGQGEFRKCGKCGSYASVLNRENKTVTCSDCGHEWRPSDKYWSTIIHE